MAKIYERRCKSFNSAEEESSFYQQQGHRGLGEVRPEPAAWSWELLAEHGSQSAGPSLSEEHLKCHQGTTKHNETNVTN